MRWVLTVLTLMWAGRIAGQANPFVPELNDTVERVVKPGVRPYDLRMPDAIIDDFIVPEPGYDYIWYAKTHLGYPTTAVRDSIQGRVYVSVEFDSEGRQRNVCIAKGLRWDVDSTALHLVLTMPRWKPVEGLQQGWYKRIILPFSFKLEPDQAPAARPNGRKRSGG